MAVTDNMKGNPWKVTGSDTGVMTTNGVRIKKILWDSPTTAGHTLTITDNAGHEIWNRDALAAGNDIQYVHELDQYFRGVNITAHQSGTVWIFVQ